MITHTKSPKWAKNVQMKSVSKKEKSTIKAEGNIKVILEDKPFFSSRKCVQIERC